MGLGGISIWQLVIILAIVLLLFGSKKLRNIGGDLGSAVKGFKKAVNNGENDDAKNDPKNTAEKIEQQEDAAFTAQTKGEAETNAAANTDKTEK